MALIDHVYKDALLTQQFDDATDTIGAAAVNGASLYTWSISAIVNS